MIFPNTIEEYFKDYAFIDEERIYTNGSELIPTFRVKQWEEHKDKEIERLNNIITELEKYLEKERELDFNNKLCIEAILDKLKELKENI